MKTLLATLLLTSSLSSFSQDKIPATDIYNPPQSVPTTTVSTVDETDARVVKPNANGCTLNFANTQSLFIQNKKYFKKMSEIEKDYNKQTLKQGVVMVNGTKASFIKSDCTRHMMVINLQPKRILNALPHHLYRQTAGLLKNFKADRDELSKLYPLRKSLESDNWSLITNKNGVYTLPCENSKCTLSVITRDGASEIELTYEADPAK
jgi:hypothetical protein